jgi:hypothetical protein
MSRITQRISDLSGKTIADGEQVVRLVVEHHPNFDESVTLEAKPEEVDVDKLSTHGQDYVGLAIREPGDSTTRRVLLSVAEFDDLFQQEDGVDASLERARVAQRQQEQEVSLRPRVKRQIDSFGRRKILEARGIRPRKNLDASAAYEG